MWDLVGNPEDRFSQNEAHPHVIQKYPRLRDKSKNFSFAPNEDSASAQRRLSIRPTKTQHPPNEDSASAQRRLSIRPTKTQHPPNEDSASAQKTQHPPRRLSIRPTKTQHPPSLIRVRPTCIQLVANDLSFLKDDSEDSGQERRI